MKKIILQEIDPGVRDILETALSIEGYQVYAYPDYDNLLGRIARFSPDLVIMDFKLKGAECRAAFTEIRHTHPKLPIIILSCNPHIEALCSEFGFDYCLAKPFNLTVIFRLVNKLTQGAEEVH